MLRGRDLPARDRRNSELWVACRDVPARMLCRTPRVNPPAKSLRNDHRARWLQGRVSKRGRESLRVGPAVATDFEPALVANARSRESIEKPGGGTGAGRRQAIQRAHRPTALSRRGGGSQCARFEPYVASAHANVTTAGKSPASPGALISIGPQRFNSIAHNLT